MLRKKFEISALFALMVLFVSSCSSSKKEKLVDDLIEKGEMKNAIYSIPASIPRYLENYKDQINGQDFTRLVSIVHSALSPDHLYQGYRKKLIQLSNEADLKQDLLIGDSSEVQKVVLATKEAFPTTPEKMADFQNFVKDLSLSPPSATRIEFILEIDDLLLTSHTLTESQLGINLVLMTAVHMVKKMPKNTRTQILLGLKKVAPQIQLHKRNNVVEYLLYAYRSLSNDDLKSYLKAINHPSLKRMNRTYQEANYYVYELATARVKRAVTENSILQ